MWSLFIYVTLVYSEATIIIVPLNSKSKKAFKNEEIYVLLDGSFIATCLDIDILAICLINEWLML